MSRLSIIVPARYDPDALEETLVSVLENRPIDCEIIVVHPGNYDDPYGLADEVVFIEVDRNTCLVGTIAAGIQASQGAVIHLLECGASVDVNWTDHAMARFDDGQCGAVAPLVLDAANRSMILAEGISYGLGGTRRVHGAGKKWSKKRRASYKILGPTLAAAFYRRSALEAVGGLCTAVGTELVDIDIALSLRAVGYRVAIEPRSRVYGRVGNIDRSERFRRGRMAEQLFWRHASHVGWFHSLLVHPVSCCWKLIVRLPLGGAVRGLLGRMCGLLSVKSAIGDPQRLRSIRSSAGGSKRATPPHGIAPTERKRSQSRACRV